MAVEELATGADRLITARRDAAAFAGSLAELSVSDVLQMLHELKKTGALVLSRDEVSATIVLADGQIVGCCHPDGEFSSGIEGDMAALERVTDATLMEVLRWGSGRFGFEADKHLNDQSTFAARAAAGGLSTTSALLNALSHIDERLAPRLATPLEEALIKAAGAPGPRDGWVVGREPWNSILDTKGGRGAVLRARVRPVAASALRPAVWAAQHAASALRPAVWAAQYAASALRRAMSAFTGNRSLRLAVGAVASLLVLLLLTSLVAAWVAPGGAGVGARASARSVTTSPVAVVASSAPFAEPTHKAPTAAKARRADPRPSPAAVAAIARISQTLKAAPAASSVGAQHPTASSTRPASPK